MNDRGKIADHWENNGPTSASGLGQLIKEMENSTLGSIGTVERGDLNSARD